MNDYDPITASPPPPPPPPMDPHLEPFSIGGACDHGWQIFKRHYGILLGGSALVAVLSIALNGVEKMLNASAFPAGSLVSLVAGFFLMPVLQTGLLFVAVRAARSEPIAFEHMFDGFRRYWPIVGVNALAGLIFAGAVMPFAGVMGVAAALSGGRASVVVVLVLIGILAFAVLLALYVRLSFASVICLDPAAGEGVVGAIRRSWEITGPYWGPLTVLQIVLWLVLVGSLLLFCVGIILLGLPLVLAINGAAYAALLRPRQLPRCEACGYDTSGLNTRICPECGATLHNG